MDNLDRLQQEHYDELESFRGKNPMRNKLSDEDTEIEFNVITTKDIDNYFKTKQT